MSNPLSDRLWRLIFVGCAVLLGGLVLLQGRQLTTFAGIEEAIRDYFVRTTASSPVTDSRIAVIDIDEHSLQEIGGWPWSRPQLADLLEILLQEYQVRGIALDMVLPEKGDALGDARLQSLTEHAPVVLAQVFDYSANPQGLRQGILADGLVETPEFPTVPATGFMANHAGLRSARCVGNIGFVPDGDGVLRRLPWLTLWQGRIYVPLAQRLWECANPLHPASGAVPVTPVDHRGFWRVNLPGPWERIAVFSAADVLTGRLEPQALAGRYVFIGSSSLGLSDRVATPLSPLTPGVLVHAATLSSLLDEVAQPAFPWPWQLITALWIGVTGVGAGWLLHRQTPLRSIGWLLGFALGWLSISWPLAHTSAEFSITAPLWTYLLLLLTHVPYEWYRSRQQADKALMLFAQYLAPSVLAQLMQLPLNQTLQPRRCEVTVLVADMEGYTPRISTLPLEEAGQLTRDFLECLTRAVLRYEGTLDKYTGDGLVAFWGAPLPCAHHADMAIQAGRAILQEVDAWNKQREAQGKEVIRVRVGVESGSAVVGDLGSSFRSAYTAVGDCINHAAKLQESARHLPARLVIGPGAQHRSTDTTLVPLSEVRLARGTLATYTIADELQA